MNMALEVHFHVYRLKGINMLNSIHLNVIYVIAYGTAVLASSSTHHGFSKIGKTMLMNRDSEWNIDVA